MEALSVNMGQRRVFIKQLQYFSTLPHTWLKRQDEKLASSPRMDCLMRY